jgi:hypothetical protein
MNWRYRLLRIDSLGALSVGVMVLLLSNYLTLWLGLPQSSILFMGIVNIAYGCYSLSLLVRTKRPLSLITVLVIANLLWALLCVLRAALFAQTATPLGIAYLLLEALYVGGLAYLEWRNREFLLVKSPHLKETLVAESD